MEGQVIGVILAVFVTGIVIGMITMSLFALSGHHAQREEAQALQHVAYKRGKRQGYETGYRLGHEHGRTGK